MVIDALRMMRDHNEAALLVFDPAKAERQDEFPRSADACAGILTERDYLRKVVLVGRGSFTTPVADIMTPRSRVRVLSPRDSVLDAMRLMAARDIRNVPVVDDRAMAGVLTIEDVVRALLRDGSEEVAALRHFIAGTSPHGLA